MVRCLVASFASEVGIGGCNAEDISFETRPVRVLEYLDPPARTYVNGVHFHPNIAPIGDVSFLPAFVMAYCPCVVVVYPEGCACSWALFQYLFFGVGLQHRVFHWSKHGVGMAVRIHPVVQGVGVVVALFVVVSYVLWCVCLSGCCTLHEVIHLGWCDYPLACQHV